MDLGDEGDRRPTIADVPGLIEGASEGAGLGHAFLRHIERTRVLIHVVDGAARDVAWDYGVIRDELEAHDPALLAKPIVVAFNKIDLPTAADAWPEFKRARKRDGLPVVAIAAATGTGIDELRTAIAALLPSGEELAELPAPTGVVVHRITGAPDAFSVELDGDGTVRLRGRRIELLAAQTNFDVDESAERFQRELQRSGIDAELRRAGIAPGDVVRIGPIELEWEAELWRAVR
jgi:GTP-binding protein